MEHAYTHVRYCTVRFYFSTALYVSTFLLYCTVLRKFLKGCFVSHRSRSARAKKLRTKLDPRWGAARARALNPEINSTHKRYPRARRAKLSISGLEQAGGKRMARPFLNICLGSYVFGIPKGTFLVLLRLIKSAVGRQRLSQDLHA